MIKFSDELIEGVDKIAERQQKRMEELEKNPLLMTDQSMNEELDVAIDEVCEVLRLIYSSLKSEEEISIEKVVNSITFFKGFCDGLPGLLLNFALHQHHRGEIKLTNDFKIPVDFEDDLDNWELTEPLI